MSPVVYSILHVISILVLTGYTFYAFGAPADTKKRVMIITGFASLLALVAGFGLQAKLNVGWPGWLIDSLLAGTFGPGGIRLSASRCGGSAGSGDNRARHDRCGDGLHQTVLNGSEAQREQIFAGGYRADAGGRCRGLRTSRVSVLLCNG